MTLDVSRKAARMHEFNKFLSRAPRYRHPIIFQMPQRRHSTRSQRRSSILRFSKISGNQIVLCVIVSTISHTDFAGKGQLQTYLELGFTTIERIIHCCIVYCEGLLTSAACRPFEPNSVSQNVSSSSSSSSQWNYILLTGRSIQVYIHKIIADVLWS